MYDSGDICIPTKTGHGRVNYLSARNVVTGRKAAYSDILLFVCWHPEGSSYSDRRIAKFILPDGSIVMLYDGEFHKI